MRQNSVRCKGVPNLRVGSEQSGSPIRVLIEDARKLQTSRRDVSTLLFRGTPTGRSSSTPSKPIRDPFLESQLKDGQITVRDFIRGPGLSETPSSAPSTASTATTRLFATSPAKDPWPQGERQRRRVSWSIVIATKGLEGLVDRLRRQRRVRSTPSATTPFLTNATAFFPAGMGETYAVQRHTPRYGVLPGHHHASPRSSTPAAPPRKFLPRAKVARWFSLRLHGLGGRNGPTLVEARPPAVAPTWTTCRRFPTAAVGR